MLEEHKPLKGKVDGIEVDIEKLYYYPGFTLVINTVRDPFSKIIRIFLPAFILAGFLYETFEIEEFHDRLNNISICLLTYIGIMQNMRSELPEISKLTSADVFLIIWATLSLFPILDRLVLRFPSTNSDDAYDIDLEPRKLMFRSWFKYSILVIGVICLCWVCYSYFSSC